MSINADDGDELTFVDSGTPYPFLQYEGGGKGGEEKRSGNDKSSRSKTGKKSAASAASTSTSSNPTASTGGVEKAVRPKSASRRREDSTGTKVGDDAYKSRK